MGWDCTLHVVDDTSLARFAARFLHGLHRDTAFDQQYDAADMIAKVKRLIASDVDTGARALGELALLYASTQTPHVFCRDFSLSLWNDEAMNAALPSAWLGSVETLLPDIVAAYPSIAGRVPKAFDQNFCVGPYVAARHVPALLAHVEEVLGAMAPADRARYQALCDVLRVAASRGLAYWEGTDIDVAQANEDWLLPTRSRSLRIVPSPLTSPLAKLLAISETQALVGEHFVLHDIDISSFPPKVTTHADMQVTAAAFTPWDTQFVRMATDRTQRPFKFSYYELPDRTPLTIEPPFTVGLVRSSVDSLLLLPQAAAREGNSACPVVMRHDHSLELLPLPEPVEAQRSADPREPLSAPEPNEVQRVGCDAMTFGDGTSLIVWDGKGYCWAGAGFPVLVDSALEAAAISCAVTLSDGSIVAAFAGTLLRIDLDGRRHEALPIENVTALALAADDAIVISEGDNPEGDSLKLWWPKTREITHVHPDILALDERPTFVYFDSAAQLLVVARPSTWHALPWAELAAMRRVPDDVFIARRTANTEPQTG